MEAKPVPDKRRLPHWWYYLLFPALTVQGFFVRRVLGLIWGNIFVVYGLIPLLDQMIKQDWQNPTLEEIMKIEKQNRYRFCLYIVIFLEWLLFFVSVVKQTEVTVWTIAPMLFIRANMYASGFLVAHELFHKENHLDKFVGTVHMIKSCYMHFMVEHIYGHHKNVSTPLDPASAPKDMNVYKFIPHSVKGGYLSAYKINPRFVTLSTIASLMLILGIWKFVGIQAMLMHIVSVVGGVSYLEAINYVEHYGLRRKQLSNGSYEKVTIRHSWNSAHTISNFFFFKLQRHSDHHQNSLKPYQTLCTYEDSPQLPHGYLVCILLAFFPKTWFDIMNPLVDEYNSKTSTKGTEMTALKIAEEKTKTFVWKFTAGVSLLLFSQIIAKLVM